MVSAAILFLTSVVYAGHPAPGVQIIVNQGGATVFQAITDATGHFSTTTLAPGEYQFEVRGPKVVPPVRYFLVLGGARPVGQPITNAAGDLGMQAQVRRAGSIRGQVSSSRIIVLPGAPPLANATPSVAATSSSPRDLHQPTLTVAAGQRPSAPLAGASTPSVAPSTTLTRAVPVNRAGVAVANGSNPSLPATAAGSSTRTSTSLQRPPQNAPVASAPAVPPYKIIAGKRYVWVPSAPGSSVGHWILETPEHQTAPRAAEIPPAQTTSQGSR